MGKYDDKYNEAGEEQTHVRSIINQLNEDHPSKEKKREVVTRPDGTKVIRVTKKRRVTVSESEKNRRSRHSFVMGLLVAFLCLLGMGAFFGFRMSVMSGDAFLTDGVEQLKQAWGATDIRVSGKGVDGGEFRLSTLVAEFPESSILERVEISDISADLDSMSFFTKKLVGDIMKMGRVEVRLRADARKFAMPRFKGGDLWSFRRVECEEFGVKMGESQQDSPVTIRNCKAYMYYPREGEKDTCVLDISGGSLQLAGWKTIYMKEGRFTFSPVAVEEFSVSGSTDRPTETAETNHTELMIFGRLGDGDKLAGPFSLDVDNIDFADLSDNRFSQFFAARSESVGREKAKAHIELPLDRKAPQFSGEFAVKAISITGMAAQTLMAEHIDPMKRRMYLPPRVSRGMVELSQEGDASTLTLPEDAVVERDLIAVQGKVTVNGANEISGNLDYALPVLLTHVEYPDAISDPIFQDVATNAWLRTTVSGMANHPTDNSSEIEAKAVEARKSRPARIPFSEIDVERMADQMRREKMKDVDPFAPQGSKAPAPAGDTNGTAPQRNDDPFGDNPANDDPFALPTPF